MIDLFRRVKQKLAGYMDDHNELFRDGWEQVAAGNLQMLQRSTVIATFFVALALVLVVLYRPMQNLIAALAGGLVFVGCMALYVNAKSALLRWRPRLINFLCFVHLGSMTALLIYNCTMGLIRDPGLLFAPFMIVLSMTFVMPAWKSVLFLNAAILAFVVASYEQKPADVFSFDLTMAIVTWLLSHVTGMELLRLRIREYRQRRELMHMSSTDSLTGLMNKYATETSARHYLEQASTLRDSALFVIDLDQFKLINDQLGHQVGDEALELVGNTLLRLFRAQDIVGRVGGDEFVALMKNATDPNMVKSRAAIICRAMRHTKLKELPISLTCSIGVAMCPINGRTYDELFTCADEQLYQVKRRGKDGYSLATQQ